MLSQKLEQKLLQKLSPQQIQLMKLLQVPAMMLEERIKQEIEINPALEEGEDTGDELENMSVEDDYDIDYADEELNVKENTKSDESPESVKTEDVTEIDYETEKKDDSEEFSFDDYIEDDEYIPAYKTAQESSPDEEKKDIPFASSASFQDFLISQLGMQPLDDKHYQIGLHIIGNIDESGYMQRDLEAMTNDLAFSQNLVTNINEIKDILEIIQQFDPPGVGARNLQECLLIQLKKIEELSEAVLNAIIVIDKYFDDFIKKHYDKIELKSGISEEALKDANAEIMKLNPKPGNILSDAGKSSQYIVPDFNVSVNNDELILSLVSRNAPELHLNKTYLEMVDGFSKNGKSKSSKEKEAMLFVKQKLESARWFIDALKQRENTLYSTMYAIMNYQREYFLSGDEMALKPMILKDIADVVKLDISTISRVANSKYVQTPYGVFLLKTFFSEGMQKESGEEVSTREVRKIMQDCIDAEDKSNPLNDDELAKILKEKGYKLARRTVAKYREHMNVPVARLRKEL